MYFFQEAGDAEGEKRVTRAQSSFPRKPGAVSVASRAADVVYLPQELLKTVC